MNLKLCFFVCLIFKTLLFHKCGHSIISKKIGSPNIIDVSSIRDNLSPNERRLQNDQNWRKIDITFDLTYIGGANEESQVLIKDVIIPILKADFEEMMQVKGLKSIPAFSKTACDDFFEVPKKYQNSSTETDLIIFVSLFKDNSNFLAFAGPCSSESEMKRPVVGMMLVNEKFINLNKPYVRNLQMILKHEIFHILAFSPNLYPLFNRQNPAFEEETVNTNSGKKILYKFTSEKILEVAREHFACNEVKGIYLENEGTDASSGAHFEKTIFGNEIMTSEKAGHSSLSEFTLALMEDSGWYKLNYAVADQFHHGKGNGCEFLNHNCSTSFKEFCDKNGTLMCSRDYIGKAICTKSGFSDNCLFKEYLSTVMCNNTYDFLKTVNIEEPGPFSRCFPVFQDSKQSAGCFKSSCEAGAIVIEFGSETLRCEKNGQIIEKLGLQLVCPDITDFCDQLKDSCPNDCNGFGLCRNNKECDCDYFHTGSTCQSDTKCDSSFDLEFCDKLYSTKSNIAIKTSISLVLLITAALL